MGPGPHRHAGTIDDGRNVVRMGALELEGGDRALVARMTEDAQRVDLAQPVMRIGDQVALVRLDAGLADRLDVVEGGAEADRLRSEEHTSELQSRRDLVCRLLLEKKKKQIITHYHSRTSRRHQIIT